MGLFDGITGDNGNGVDTSSQDFVGVSNQGIQDFFEETISPALAATVQAIKNHVAVFKALDDGWEGIAKQNFKSNFVKGELKAGSVIAASYKTLIKEIAGIAQGMLDQDRGMVETVD